MIEKEYLIELQVNLMAINPEEYTPKLLAQKIYETSKREVSTLPEHEEEKNLTRNFFFEKMQENYDIDKLENPKQEITSYYSYVTAPQALTGDKKAEQAKEIYDIINKVESLPKREGNKTK